MSRLSPSIHTFNRGIVSPRALARVDMDRIAMGAEVQTNYMPSTLGSMMMRPGMKYLGRTDDDKAAIFIPFIYELDDTALLEFTASTMRVWIDDAIIERDQTLTATITSSDMSSATGWTDNDESGAASTFAGGYMELLGSGTSAAQRYQAVSIASGETALEHALRVTVQRGPVMCRIGTTAGGDDLFAETSLDTGVHSLAFTPGATTIYVQFGNRKNYTTLVDSAIIETTRFFELPAPYAAADLGSIRWSQSRDVVYLACDGYQQRKIERRSARSWSITKYEPQDGPFRLANTETTTLTPAALSGDTTLTASSAVFKSTHVGALFRVSSVGQAVSGSISSAVDTYTDTIRVTGVGDSRKFTAEVASGTTSTVKVQKSLDLDGTFEDVQTVTAGTSVVIDDGLDNQIIFYRIGVASGDYVDAASFDLTYARGSIDGIARVTAYNSATSVDVVVLQSFGGTSATKLWSEGAWSDYRGYPTSVKLFEGRLWWAGRGSLWGSVSDAFESFDDTLEGDSAPIDKTVSDGPSDKVPWLEATTHLMMGAAAGEFIARSSSLDEPLTPTACSLRRFATNGSANVPAVAVDTRVVYVQRSGKEVYEAEIQASDFSPTPVRLTALAPELGEPSIVRMAYQAQPDPRIHCVRSDGVAVVLVTEPGEGIRCWVKVETDGVIEDVVVLPDTLEDAVYYIVKRTIEGDERRMVERWAREDEAQGGDLNCIADCYASYTFGTARNTANGFPHLEGETVVVWADGTPRGTAVVSSGTITFSGDPATNIVAGLTYTAQYKSTKLAYGVTQGSNLTKPKRVNDIGVILRDFHKDSLTYGADFASLFNMPRIEDYQEASDAVQTAYDEAAFPFGGTWDTDSRVCLQTTAPYPVTVLALVIDVDTPDRYRNTRSGVV